MSFAGTSVKKTGEDGTYVPALLMSSGQKGGVATYGTDSSLSFSSSVEIHDRVDGRGGGTGLRLHLH